MIALLLDRTIPEILQIINEEYAKQNQVESKILNKDLPKDKSISHIVITPKQYDSVIASDLVQQQIIDNNLTDLYPKITHTHMYEDNPISILSTYIEQSYRD
jgi:hypothetical protein